MAASTVEESPVKLSPDEVGKAFAYQYYMLLEYNPSLAYRFYEERSKLGRSENGGSMSLTTTMEAINEKIRSYGSLKAEIKSIDAQWSYNEGVIVLITGYMINPDISRRAFTQTFFLAPQEKGYFVLNDIFRYVEDDHISQHGDRIAPSTPSEEEALPVQKKHSYEQSNEKAVNPSENGEVLVKEGKEEKEEEPVAVVVDEAPNESEVVVDEAPNQLEVVVDEAPNQLEVVVDEAPNQTEVVADEAPNQLEVVVDEAPNQSEVVVDEAPNQSEVVIESNDKVEEAPKKSYASIVMKDSLAKASFPNLQKSVDKMQVRQVDVPPAPSTVTTAPSSNSDMADYENNQEDKGDGHSIYASNLPMNVPYEVVAEKFNRFGPIKSDGIQIIVSNDGFCYGFVEFEEADAARSAIQASPIIIGRCDVWVEEKRSKRGMNRGRGGFCRNEGSRGRGGYYGHGDRNNNNFSNKGQGYQYPSGKEEEYGGGGHFKRYPGGEEEYGGGHFKRYPGGEEEYGGGHVNRGGRRGFGVSRGRMRMHAPKE